MSIRIWLRSVVGVFAIFGAVSSHAQTTAGSGTVIVVPVVAQTSTFTTEVFVRNPNAASLTLNVLFYEAQSSSTPGLRTCSNFVVGSSLTLSFTLNAQCTLAAGNHHGQLILQDAAAQKINLFYAYTRTQTSAGNGFSVEGFPIGNFSGSSASVIGLKRSSTGANYATNCFVGALGEAINYKISLFTGATNTQLGSDITGTLSAFQSIRYLDVLTVAGAPAGDYTNVRAVFSSTSGAPSIVGLCTVQESITFGADFRVAKSQDAFDSRAKRLTCYAQDTCGTVNAVNPTQVPNSTLKMIHSLFIQQPDYVECQLVSPHLADLQVQIRGPGGDVFAAPVFPSSPPFDSGGAGKTSFYIYTGEKSTINGGSSTRWFIDVGFRTVGGVAGDLPVDYGITCNSGNGVSIPYFRAQAALDF